jgi:hypothetical protein
VYLDGVFGREHRKLESAIQAGFGGGRRWKEGREDTGEGCQGGGEGRIRCYRDLSSSKRVAPVWRGSPERVAWLLVAAPCGVKPLGVAAVLAKKVAPDRSAPVWERTCSAGAVPVLQDSLRRRGWHLFRGRRGGTVIHYQTMVAARLFIVVSRITSARHL